MDDYEEVGISTLSAELVRVFCFELFILLLCFVRLAWRGAVCFRVLTRLDWQIGAAMDWPANLSGAAQRDGIDYPHPHINQTQKILDIGIAYDKLRLL